MNPFEEYRITSPYGWRMHPVYGERRFHTGIDLVKAHQAPIYAFVAGRVLFSGEGVSGSGFGNYGNVVGILDDKGNYHCYCHLDSIVVKKGQTVDRGQMIGRQGNTGIGTGSHLHYEIRKRYTPSQGWVADAEDRAYEPTKFLEDFYAAKLPTKPEPRNFDVSVVVARREEGKEEKELSDGFIENGRTYVPLREVAEAMGAKVEWAPSSIRINGKLFTPNEERLIDGKTFVQVRDITNLLDGVVMWNDATRTVKIFY